MFCLTANVLYSKFLFEGSTCWIKLLFPSSVHVPSDRNNAVIVALTLVHNIVSHVSLTKTALVVDSFYIIRFFTVTELLFIFKISSI